MTESDVLLRDACVLAEEMIYEELLKKFDDKSVIIPKGQFERIQKIIYGQPVNLSCGDDTKIKDKKATSKRIKTALLIAALLIILLSVSATAFSPLRDFFTKIYKDCTEFVFNITNKNDYLFAEYTYIPEGYKKVKDIRVKAACSQTLLYTNEKKQIKILTIKNLNSSTVIDTENTETGNIMIDGSNGYYSITKTSIILVWSTGKYHHCLTADFNGENVNLETLVKIAQSRQPIK
ncbi:MAG: DUF4367 domain-containing protein [Clostridia bacterium]|nr:DUF4367 domain-containing protein [Clostridia bacterium]